jgi:hypothetical protein
LAFGAKQVNVVPQSSPPSSPVFRRRPIILLGRRPTTRGRRSTIFLPIWQRWLPTQSAEHGCQHGCQVWGPTAKEDDWPAAYNSLIWRPSFPVNLLLLCAAGQSTSLAEVESLTIWAVDPPIWQAWLSVRRRMGLLRPMKMAGLRRSTAGDRGENLTTIFNCVASQARHLLGL